MCVLTVCWKTFLLEDFWVISVITINIEHQYTSVMADWWNKDEGTEWKRVVWSWLLEVISTSHEEKYMTFLGCVTSTCHFPQNIHEIFYRVGKINEKPQGLKNLCYFLNIHIQYIHLHFIDPKVCQNDSQMRNNS